MQCIESSSLGISFIHSIDSLRVRSYFINKFHLFIHVFAVALSSFCRLFVSFKYRLIFPYRNSNIIFMRFHVSFSIVAQREKVRKRNWNDCVWTVEKCWMRGTSSMSTWFGVGSFKPTAASLPIFSIQKSSFLHLHPNKTKIVSTSFLESNLFPKIFRLLFSSPLDSLWSTLIVFIATDGESITNWMGHKGTINRYIVNATLNDANAFKSNAKRKD